MDITYGKIKSAQKVVIYGPEGIGKSTFASKFPDPLFIDTEGSTKHLDVARTPRPTSWTMLLQQVKYVRDKPGLCKTLVIDTADWAEQLCSIEVCAKYQKKGIEDFGYGKGYVYLAEEFGKLLNLLEELIDRGTNVCMTAHAIMRKFEQPDELGSYDRWEMKLQKKTAPLVKEWADIVLFANYKTYVVNVDGQGSEKGKNKAQGGARVMYTSHHPCWDAKNRHGLAPEVKFDYAEIAHILAPEATTSEEIKVYKAEEIAKTMPGPAEKKEDLPSAQGQSLPAQPPSQPPAAQEAPPPQPQHAAALPTPPSDSGIPRALADLMAENKVIEPEIQLVVAEKGYYPAGTPIRNYDPNFINGVLIRAWPKVYSMIEQTRAAAPF